MAVVMEEDLEICMRCGFCRANCPVFDETMAESGTARGKIAIIRAMKNGDLEPSKAVAKKIFECTMCGRCSQGCPAGVDTLKIFIEARRELSKDKLSSQKRVALYLLERPEALSLLGRAASLIPDQVLSVPQRGAKAELEPLKNPEMRVAFFGGCVTNYFLPDIRESGLEVLAQNNIEAVMVEEKCCGIPYYFSGDVENASKLAKENLSRLESLGVNAIVTACPTCKTGFKRYPEMLEGSWQNRAEKVVEKTYEICEFLNKFVYSNELVSIDKSFTYHEPCHMLQDGNPARSALDIVTSVEGMKLREMNNPEACCGFGGLFSIDNPKLSKEMNERKIADILGTKADLVITPCPGCIMHIQQGLRKKDIKIEVRHPIQLLRGAYKGDES
jgi:glycolate oxidase iron-sulfur subunit